MSEWDAWGASATEWLFDTSKGPAACYTGGVVWKTDGCIMCAAPAGWGLLKEGYSRDILQPDGETVKNMEIKEYEGIKALVETKCYPPPPGLWIGGNHYKLLREVADSLDPLHTFALACGKKGAQIVTAGDYIVMALSDKEKGQQPGNAMHAACMYAAALAEENIYG